jgi:divalent metal cation (Fe/Co/Zn/Cd) transporter
VQSAAVLLTLAVIAVWPGGWWLDPTVGLVIAGFAVWEGFEAWRGRIGGVVGEAATDGQVIHLDQVLTRWSALHRGTIDDRH